MSAIKNPARQQRDGQLLHRSTSESQQDQQDRISSTSSSASSGASTSASSGSSSSEPSRQDDRSSILKPSKQVKQVRLAGASYSETRAVNQRNHPRRRAQDKGWPSSSKRTKMKTQRPEAVSSRPVVPPGLPPDDDGDDDGGGFIDYEDFVAHSNNLGAGNLNAVSILKSNPNHRPNNKPDHNPESSKSTGLLIALFLIGLIVCVASTICILLLPSLVSNQIAKKLVLKNNSMLLERWSKPNVPMYFKVWLYDVKNAQEIIDKRDTKPRLEEIGPFVFNLKRQKDVISFAGDNLYYTERRVFHFNRKLSCCAINTTVTIPNIPLVAVVDRALGYNLPLLGRFIPRLINRAIQSLREQLFVRKQVGEILFDGYDVELLKMVSRIGSLVGLPQQSQKFALLKGRNDTWRPEQDGVWAINTGQRDRRQFGKVASWNSYKKLPFWPASQCNVINGSDGTLFPPPIKRTEPLYIFNQELCRTVNLVFHGPSDVRSIDALRFVLNPMNFAHTMRDGQRPEHEGVSVGAPSPPPINLPTIALSRLTNSANQQQQQQQQRLLQEQLRLQTALAPPQPPAQPPRATRPNPLFQNPRLQPQIVSPSSLVGEQELPLTSGGGGGGGGDSTTSGQTRSRQPSTRATNSRSATIPRPEVLAAAAASEHQRQLRPRRRAAESSAQRANEQTSVAPSPPPSSPPSAPQSPANNAGLAQQQTPATAAAAAAAAPAPASPSRDTAEANIRRQQEKLIRVAQSAQLATERKSELNPQTCFCDRKTTNLNGVNVCEFDGLIDLSKCSKQAQVIFGSMPHFYNSDPRLLNQVSGLTPNASKHTTYLDIEPNTGLVLGGKRRVQLNVIIKHNNEIDGFENINDMLVPIVWFEESALIPEETAQKFRSMYVDKIRMINLILFSLLTASIVLLAVDARLLISTRRWRQFKLMRSSTNGGQISSGGGGAGSTGATGATATSGRRQTKTPAAGRNSAAQNHKSPKGHHLYEHQAANGGHATARRHDQRRSSGRFNAVAVAAAAAAAAAAASSPLVAQLANARKNSPGNAASPLLHDSASSAATSPANVSPPGSPQDSPELRKWAPVVIGGGRTLTRVHLNQQVAGAPDGQRNEWPPERVGMLENGKSIVEVNAGGRLDGAPFHLVEQSSGNSGAGGRRE